MDVEQLKGTRMKQFFGFALTLMLLIGCDVNGAGETTTGSSKDTQISNLEFTIDSTYLQGSPAALVAQGKVKNKGTSTITSPWYVEAAFFTDSTLTTKLGGNNAQILVALSTNQQTFWKVQFSSSNVNVLSYPKFKVSEIRGIYKN